MLCTTVKPRQNRFRCFNNDGIYASVVEEKALLSKQAKFLENQLDEVKKRLSSID